MAKVNRADEREQVRTTILLAQIVYRKATELMATKGFNRNFSAYVADLIRRDAERNLKENHNHQQP